MRVRERRGESADDWIEQDRPQRAAGRASLTDTAKNVEGAVLEDGTVDVDNGRRAHEQPTDGALDQDRERKRRGVCPYPLPTDARKRHRDVKQGGAIRALVQDERCLHIGGAQQNVICHPAASDESALTRTDNRLRHELEPAIDRLSHQLLHVRQ